MGDRYHWISARPERTIGLRASTGTWAHYYSELAAFSRLGFDKVQDLKGRIVAALKLIVRRKPGHGKI